MEQLDQQNVSLKGAQEKNYLSRNKVVDAYNLRHEAQMNHGEYERGELVLVYNEALENHFSGKGEPRWHGPYAIVAQWPSGTYIIQELYGAVLKQPIAWKTLKSYVPCHGLELEPAILAPKWITPIDKFEADLIKDDSDEMK